MMRFNFTTGPVPVLDPARLDTMARVATAQPQLPRRSGRVVGVLAWFDAAFTVPRLAPVRVSALVLACGVVFVAGFYATNQGALAPGRETVVASTADDVAADLVDMVLYDDETTPEPSNTSTPTTDDAFGDALWAGVLDDLT